NSVRRRLRSFPPRRSSDLLSAAQGKLGSSYVWGARGPDEFDSSGIITWAYRQVIPDLMFRIGPRSEPDANHAAIYRWNFHPLPLDRKSTRLNSSHVKSSYA